MSRRNWIRACAAAAVAVCAATAHAQAFPTKPIKMVVPFPPGAATDTLARVYAQALTASLGQPVLVENKAGADGAISAMEVMRAAPDGYTLLFGTSSPMAAAPAMKKAPPYDPNTDFTPIADIGRYTFFIYLHPSVPAKTVAEFVAYAKANPNKISYATGNTTGIVSTALFSSLAGIQMVHVPYKGEPQALTDLVAGRVQFMVASAGTTVAFAKEGRLRPIAVTLNRRSPALPDVPTIAEAGMPKFALSSWAAVFGPKGMPRDVVERLNKEFGAAGSKPEILSTFEKQSFQHVHSTPEQLAALVKEQYQVFRDTLKAAGVEPE
jgi:tripartite-type tricarboxylate transporter receptor subunit TctC